MLRDLVTESLLKAAKPRFDDDIIDRLNYYYTPWIMCLFAILTSTKQYFGAPLQCWVPAEFVEAWETYTEYYCFAQNTYFLPIEEQIPAQFEDRRVKEIGYYQWVPFVLALQSFMFFFPILVWRMFNWQSGIRTKIIANMAVDAENIEGEKREKNVKTLANHLQASLDLQRDIKPPWYMFGCLTHGKHYGGFVTGLYLFVKLLFIVNVVGQFFIMNSFLGSKYTFWGLEILRDLMAGKPWEESGHFPRVTLCDFLIRRDPANIHPYTVQCVLLVNMFNEKIYLFLWWWFLIISILNCLNFLHWFLVSVTPRFQRAFIESYLRAADIHGEQRQLRKFVHANLRPDGVLLIRLMSANGGDLIVTELVDELWQAFRQRNRLPEVQIEVEEEKLDSGLEEDGIEDSLKEKTVKTKHDKPMANKLEGFI